MKPPRDMAAKDPMPLDAAQTRMFQEARDAPARVRVQLEQDAQHVLRVAEALQRFNPRAKFGAAGP